MTPAEYRAAGRWWREEALTSKNPEELMGYARNQETIAADMEYRPTHYARKPPHLTAWQWLQERSL